MLACDCLRYRRRCSKEPLAFVSEETDALTLTLTLSRHDWAGCPRSEAEKSRWLMAKVGWRGIQVFHCFTTLEHFSPITSLTLIDLIFIPHAMQSQEPIEARNKLQC